MYKCFRNVKVIATMARIAIVSLSTIVLFATNRVSATDPSVVDEIDITVPVSCTLSGTGMNTHTASIQVFLTITVHSFRAMSHQLQTSYSLQAVQQPAAASSQ